MLGPFHTHDAPVLPNGSCMTTDPAGEPMLAVCTVQDTRGRPVAGVKVDIWETDSSGHYDVQHEGREGASERCIMMSDEYGRFWFQGLKPVSYAIPHDGPVGKLLGKLGRHPWRPAHVHFMFEKEGWDHLITYVLLLLLSVFARGGWANASSQGPLSPGRPVRDLGRRVWSQAESGHRPR